MRTAKPGTEKIHISVRLKPSLIARANAECAESGQTMTQLVDKALNEYLTFCESARVRVGRRTQPEGKVDDD